MKYCKLKEQIGKIFGKYIPDKGLMSSVSKKSLTNLW